MVSLATLLEGFLTGLTGGTRLERPFLFSQRAPTPCEVWGLSISKIIPYNQLMVKNRLVLIDSFALIYRAFYGLPMALTHDGQPINAAYGFTSALLSAIKALEPEYLVAGIDLPKPTKRKEEYAEYKAHRKPMPEDLRPQIQYCKEVLKAMNIPVIGVEGYEGEDVIATIVAKVTGNSGQGIVKKQKLPAAHYPLSTLIESIIVTGDSDTYQLIDEATRVYSMARGANQAVMYDENKVKERYGLEPSQFVDYKALRGDPSDNIPGVPGIGEKGASMLIQRFGSLDKLYEILNNKLQILSEFKNFKIKELNENLKLKIKNCNLKEISQDLKISEKIIKLLLNNYDIAYLSQKLATIQKDAPIEFNLKEARIHDYDREKVVELFQKLGFRSLIPRLHEEHKPEPQPRLF